MEATKHKTHRQHSDREYGLLQLTGIAFEQRDRRLQLNQSTHIEMVDALF